MCGGEVSYSCLGIPRPRPTVGVPGDPRVLADGTTTILSIRWSCLLANCVANYCLTPVKFICTLSDLQLTTPRPLVIHERNAGSARTLRTGMEWYSVLSSPLNVVQTRSSTNYANYPKYFKMRAPQYGRGRGGSQSQADPVCPVLFGVVDHD